MKVLIAVDGSKPSLDAVKCLIEHAALYREKPSVELVTVHLPVPKLPGMAAAGVGSKQIKTYYDEEGEVNLAPAKELLDAAGIAHKGGILVGPIAESIVRHAHDMGCELICIGTRGMTASANLLLGSTATKVLHISDIPVLLVK